MNTMRPRNSNEKERLIFFLLCSTTLTFYTIVSIARVCVTWAWLSTDCQKKAQNSIGWSWIYWKQSRSDLFTWHFFFLHCCCPWIPNKWFELWLYYFPHIFFNNTIHTFITPVSRQIFNSEICLIFKIYLWTYQKSCDLPKDEKNNNNNTHKRTSHSKE